MHQMKCEHCGADIRAKYYIGLGKRNKRRFNCHVCGKIHEDSRENQVRRNDRVAEDEFILDAESDLFTAISALEDADIQLFEAVTATAKVNPDKHRKINDVYEEVRDAVGAAEYAMSLLRDLIAEEDVK